MRGWRINAWAYPSWDSSAGIDLDPACRFPYEANNSASFLIGDVADIEADDLLGSYPPDALKILVGCAPCQPFSRYSRGRSSRNDQKWGLLKHFSRLVEGVRPTVVSMKNVPELARQDVFENFTRLLESLDYHVTYTNAFCPDYGIPQQRTRLVLLASLIGKIMLLPPTHSPRRYRTVKDAISKLPRLDRGKVDVKDHLHRACNLSAQNIRRIRSSQPGGHWNEWPADLINACHKEDSGKNYVSVYGRMEWNSPSPTITTQFFGFGNGRFGHPEQDRAISLREGAILQSFPRKYRFCSEPSEVTFSALGRLIGNAVPVRLGKIIGKSILKHLAEFNG